MDDYNDSFNKKAEEQSIPYLPEENTAVRPEVSDDALNTNEQLHTQVNDYVSQPEGQPEKYVQRDYYSYNPYLGEYRSRYGQTQQRSFQNEYFDQYHKPKRRKTKKIVITVVAAIAVITAGCLFGYWALNQLNGIFNFKKNDSYSLNSSSSETNGAADAEKLVINSKPSGANEYSSNSDGSMTSAAVINKVSPSIVGIVQYVNSNNGLPTINGQGSGIIIGSDGYILTNAHVVDGASMITVVLNNDEEYRATLKGSDTQSDLAVLKIEKTGLKTVDLGNSSQVVVGESVIAIGNPGGLQLAGSCTGGMISGVDRTITSDSTGYAMKYIQTDAAINPGNSGGALVNMYGQVIGINSAKVVASGYEGLGFAIPINDAIPIVNDLQKYGYVKNRAKIGIKFQLISETVSQYYNYSIPSGLLITQIEKDSGLSSKDVEVNDIITEIDGKKITSSSVVYSVLQEKKPGQKVTLTIFRMGTRSSTSKTYKVQITLLEDKGK